MGTHMHRGTTVRGHGERTAVHTPGRETPGGTHPAQCLDLRPAASRTLGLCCSPSLPAPHRSPELEVLGACVEPTRAQTGMSLTSCLHCTDTPEASGLSPGRSKGSHAFRTHWITVT